MTSLLAGTVAHGARGIRGMSTSHCRSSFLRVSPERGTFPNSPVAALTTLIYSIIASSHELCVSKFPTLLA